MKKILLLFVILVGCAKQPEFMNVKKELYGMKEVLVETDIHEKYLMDEKDYDEMIALESLLVIDFYEMVLVKNPSDKLKELLLKDYPVCQQKKDVVFCENKAHNGVEEIVLRYFDEKIR